MKINKNKTFSLISAFLLWLTSCGVHPKPINEMPSPGRYGIGYIILNGKETEIAFEKRGKYAFIGGDIRIPLAKVSSTRSESTLHLSVAAETRQTWPNGIIPYSVSNDFPYVDELSYAISEWARAGISWVPRTPTDVDFINFEASISETYCGLSDYGRSGKAQQIKIATTGFAAFGRCKIKNTILHEMAHALGFMHEHQRSDRDTYVSFDSPIPDDTAHVFYKVAPTQVQLTKFDLASVTMYGTEITRPKMRTKDGETISMNQSLSSLDIEGTKMLYLNDGDCKIMSARGSILYGPRPLKKSECVDLCERISANLKQLYCFFGAESLSIKQ